MTKARLLDLEDLLISSLKLTVKSEKSEIMLSYLFLSPPETQGCLGFDALSGFIPDF